MKYKEIWRFYIEVNSNSTCIQDNLTSMAVTAASQRTKVSDVREIHASY